MQRFLSCFLLLGATTLLSGVPTLAKDEEDHGDVNKLCVNRPGNEFFRLTTEGDCKHVVRCDRAGIAGIIRLAEVKCPDGLAFDLDLQTCNWKSEVSNCDKLSKPRLVKPNFATREPVCPDGQLQVGGRRRRPIFRVLSSSLYNIFHCLFPCHLQCGSGECLDQILFCDQQAHCSDGSDENACSVSEDPNRASACDRSTCQLPDCFCSADGTVIPGENSVENLWHLPIVIFELQFCPVS